MAEKLVGKDFVPHDVVAKITGRAKYAEDFRAERMAFCKTLTSPIPHARIRSIDTSAATRVKGFLGILTADEKVSDQLDFAKLADAEVAFRPPAPREFDEVTR